MANLTSTQRETPWFRLSSEDGQSEARHGSAEAARREWVAIGRPEGCSIAVWVDYEIVRLLPCVPA